MPTKKKIIEPTQGQVKIPDIPIPTAGQKERMRRGQKLAGENLRRIREAAGISQEELAKRAGIIHRNYVGKFERGETQSPEIWNVIELARALNVKITDIYKDAY